MLTEMKGKRLVSSSVCLIVLYCGSAHAYRAIYRTHDATALFGQATGTNRTNEVREMRFQKLLSGRAVIKGADNVDFSTYKASDGTSLQYSLESYYTASQAQERLEAIVKTAKRLAERKSKLDKDGRVIGDRAVLISKESKAVVVWNLGIKVHVIESSKLDHALEFERQLLQEGGVRRPGGAP